MMVVKRKTDFYQEIARVIRENKVKEKKRESVKPNVFHSHSRSSSN